MRLSPHQIVAFPSILLVASLGAGHPSALADTVTFQQGSGSGFSATDATYIQGNGGNENANFGNSSLLFAENDPGSGFVARSLIRFPFMFGTAPGQVPSNANIISATFTISKSDANFHGSSNTLTIHRVLSAWDETSVTWNSFNTGGVAGVDYEAGALDSFVPAPQTGQASFDLDVTDAVRQWAESLEDGTDINEGWIIINPQNDQATFQSEDSPLAALRPLLTIEFSPVPEPASGLLVLFGAVMLHALRRRRVRG